MRTGRGAGRNDCSLGRSPRKYRGIDRVEAAQLLTLPVAHSCTCETGDVRTGLSHANRRRLPTYDPLRPSALQEGLISEFDEKSIDLSADFAEGTSSKILSRRSLIMESFTQCERTSKRNFFQSNEMDWPCLVISNGEREREKKSSITFANVKEILYPFILSRDFREIVSRLTGKFRGYEILRNCPFDFICKEYWKTNFKHKFE